MSSRKKYTAHKRNKYTKKNRNNKRKTHKNRRIRSKNLKGGMCFGNGVGANTNDPNFSIYNTRLTQLFPYKPTN
jgi:hypothetical protein